MIGYCSGPVTSEIWASCQYLKKVSPSAQWHLNRGKIFRGPDWPTLLYSYRIAALSSGKHNERYGSKLRWSRPYTVAKHPNINLLNLFSPAWNQITYLLPILAKKQQEREKCTRDKILIRSSKNFETVWPKKVRIEEKWINLAPLNRKRDISGDFFRFFFKTLKRSKSYFQRQDGNTWTNYNETSVFSRNWPFTYYFALILFREAVSRLLWWMNMI